MEFHEKLQELRKKKGLTQEELAHELYVSRTAISKWESGRGYPNIDSLKLIGKFFGVTLDELLSSDVVLSIAENDRKQKQVRVRDVVFGLLDLGFALFFFLPLFAQSRDGIIQPVSLVALTEVAVYLRSIYFVIVIAMIAWGALLLSLQFCTVAFWQKIKIMISCMLPTIGLVLFIVGKQPYAAVLTLFMLLIKLLMLIKKQ